MTRNITSFRQTERLWAAFRNCFFFNYKTW